MKVIDNRKIWSFKDIETEFDKHILHSIPGYNNIWWTCCHMIKSFISKDTIIYDLGCSTGKQTNFICNSLEELNSLKIIGLDSEDSMIKYAKKNYINKNISFQTSNVDKYKFIKANVFLCMFLFNFLEFDMRYKVLKKINKSLKKDGVVFFADKVIDDDPAAENLMNQIHLLWKENFFSKKIILTKQEQIRGIMKPITEKKLNLLFKECGFKKNLISKHLNFNFYLLQKN